MEIIESIPALRARVRQARAQGKTIVLVPTMGFLHQGHLSMVREAAKLTKPFIIMSIFVNPLQFGPNEDYDKYPRDLERDSFLAREAGTDIIFYPSAQEMYPEGRSLTTVKVNEITDCLCGASRPGHFEGVATVVTKLFNIVSPDYAYFGQKDYQQVVVIKQLVKDLNIPVKIMVVPILRESDGLAMSSRNSYLNDKERAEAPVLFRALREAAALIEQGERRAEVICQKIKERISKESTGKIEYIEVRKADNLAILERIECPAVIALAVRFGNTRLIDNIIVGEYDVQNDDEI